MDILVATWMLVFILGIIWFYPIVDIIQLYSQSKLDIKWIPLVLVTSWIGYIAYRVYTYKKAA